MKLSITTILAGALLLTTSLGAEAMAASQIRGKQKKWGKVLMGCGRELILNGMQGRENERRAEPFMVGDLFERLTANTAKAKALAEECEAEVEALAAETTPPPSALRQKWLNYFVQNPNEYNDDWQMYELFPHAVELISSFVSFGKGYSAGSCWYVGPELMLAFGKGFTAGTQVAYCRSGDGRQWFSLSPSVTGGNGVGASVAFYLGSRGDFYVQHAPGVDPVTFREERGEFTGALGLGIHYPADQDTVINPAIGLGGYYGNSGSTFNVRLLKLKLARKWMLKKLLRGVESISDDNKSIDEDTQL
ncbi:MAG: hypothetical protein AAB425_02970 [Bdellovibrionota bacterium]